MTQLTPSRKVQRLIDISHTADQSTPELLSTENQSCRVQVDVVFAGWWNTDAAISSANSLLSSPQHLMALAANAGQKK